MIVRWLLWRAAWEQLLQLDPQDFQQVIEFKIQNELQARLDFRNPAPRNIPPCALQFRRELGLRPLAGIAETPHLRADDVVILQKFCAFLGANLGSCFRESGSAYGASFCARCRKLALFFLSPRGSAKDARQTISDEIESVV